MIMSYPTQWRSLLQERRDITNIILLLSRIGQFYISYTFKNTLRKDISLDRLTKKIS